MTRYIRTAVLFTLPLFLLKADFSFDQTSKITGGMMVSMMRMAGTFSKNARKAGEPIISFTAIKGNRMVYKSADSAQIIDLDAQTITHVNFEAKTYSVMTFEQMKKSMEDAAKKMQDQKAAPKTDTKQDPKTDTKTDQSVTSEFEVSLKDTGVKKQIAGLDTHEVVMTLKMKASDDKSTAKGSLDVVMDMWLAPSIPGYDEVRAFHKRMGEKLNWTPGGNPMMAARPDMAKAMAEVYKEGSKMDGTPVYQVVKMGGSVEGMQAAQENSTQGEQQARPAAPTPSLSDAIGGALGGRFGLGRKKKPQTDEAQPAASSQPQTQSSSGSASLMEMTIEMSNFSTSSVDGSKLEVPAGFSKVEDDATGQSGKRRK